MIGRVEFFDDRPSHVPQPTCHAVAFHGRPHRLGDNQSDARPTATPTPPINDHVRPHGTHPVLHRCFKIR